MAFFTNRNRFSITALAMAATAAVVLHGSLLMGFEQLADKGHISANASTIASKTNVARPTVTLERVVISTRRV